MHTDTHHVSPAGKMPPAKERSFSFIKEDFSCGRVSPVGKNICSLPHHSNPPRDWEDLSSGKRFPVLSLGQLREWVRYLPHCALQFAPGDWKQSGKDCSQSGEGAGSLSLLPHSAQELGGVEQPHFSLYRPLAGIIPLVKSWRGRKRGQLQVECLYCSFFQQDF